MVETKKHITVPRAVKISLLPDESCKTPVKHAMTRLMQLESVRTVTLALLRAQLEGVL